MKANGKKDLNEVVKETDDLMGWDNKYDDMIESLSEEVSKLMQFFEYVVDNTIDEKTRNIHLMILCLEVERKNYKDELWQQFSKGISGLCRYLIGRILEEVDSENKSRDSPETV